ncbi:GntR family transcriptional regulator [Streptacidiphilus anmyonensis]|uniref:GntR family transcriptional regulator n=1 Tax=Streptacidiphilus anmyonensis TaxID=405782 RepID=UPI000A00C4A6|nr:GntR family transcriptional regulator [Streptacidiphilus anmyonensis]
MPFGAASSGRHLTGNSVVQRSSLREQVAGALRDELMAGRLAAGRHFTVKEIAELYGVSATPVREALVDLAAQGMLVVEPGRGFAVPRFTWDDFVDIVEARSLVIDGIFRRLAGRLSARDSAVPGCAVPSSAVPSSAAPGFATPDSATSGSASLDSAFLDSAAVASLRRRADAAVRAARAGQLDVLVGCDRRFWAELGAFAGNARIGDYLDWLRVQYWIFAAGYLRGRDDLARFCWSRHLELVDLIAAGDLPGVHAMLLAYNQESLEQMSALCARPLPERPTTVAPTHRQQPTQVPPPREADPRPAATQ